MMTCQELTELVNDYLEGHLSLLARAQFRMHVGMCRHCRAYLQARRLTIEATGKLEAEPIPTDVRDEMLELFRDWKRE